VPKGSYILNSLKELALPRESGLKQAPGHGPTLGAVELLGNCQALQELYDDVRAPRENIEAVTQGKFAVVYAIRVEPHWFTEAWESNSGADHSLRSTGGHA
jgi:hypothetical protein